MNQAEDKTVRQIGTRDDDITFSQASFGFKNLLMGMLRPKKSVAETFKEFTALENETEELQQKNAMIETFTELIIGVVVLLGVMIVYPSIWDFFGGQFKNPITGPIYMVIIALFLIALYFVLRSLTIINYEYANLMEVFEKSRKLSLSNKKKIEFFELLPRNEYGIVFNKLDAVFRIAQEKQSVDHDSLANILYTRENLKDETPNFLANAMTMIGLVGTILGLSGATSGMESLVDSIGDYDQLKEGLNLTLGGIGVAFYTTLFGAVGMLLTRYFNLVSKKARITFLTELELVIVTEILPKLPRVVFVESATTTKKTKTTTKTPGKKVSKAATK